MSAPYYSDEHVTLYHGDCREHAEWLDCDVLVTDPPYGIRWGGIAPSYRHGVTAPPRRAVRIAGDRDTAVRDAVLAMWGDRPAGSIADPFAGTGTTLVAARALGRTAVGVEIDERYCELAARRLSQGVLDLASLTAG